MTDRTQDVVTTLQIKFEGLQIRAQRPDDLTRGVDTSQGPVVLVAHDGQTFLDVTIHAAERSDLRRVGQEVFYHLAGLTLGHNRQVHLTFNSASAVASATSRAERQRFFATEQSVAVPVDF